MALAIVLALTSAVSAEDLYAQSHRLFGPGQQLGAGHVEPPARYMHEYKGNLTVYTVSEGEAHRVCSQLFGESPTTFYPNMRGCANGDAQQCTVVVTANKPHVFRHEVAHCNGWPADHPNAFGGYTSYRR